LPKICDTNLLTWILRICFIHECAVKNGRSQQDAPPDGKFLKKNEISDIKELNYNKNVSATIVGTL
jgi:hypothetical protein